MMKIFALTWTNFRQQEVAFTDRMLAKFFAWAFSKQVVQLAVVDAISCRTPIGRMLNSHIDGVLREHTVEADDIGGLEHAIESAVENAIENIKVDADNIEDLDCAIEGAIEKALDDVDIDQKISDCIEEREDSIVEAVVKTMVQRLQGR